MLVVSELTKRSTPLRLPGERIRFVSWSAGSRSVARCTVSYFQSSVLGSTDIRWERARALKDFGSPLRRRASGLVLSMAQSHAMVYSGWHRHLSPQNQLGLTIGFPRTRARSIFGPRNQPDKKARSPQASAEGNRRRNHCRRCYLSMRATRAH